MSYVVTNEVCGQIRKSTAELCALYKMSGVAVDELNMCMEEII